MGEKTAIYLASDVHLETGNASRETKQRERVFIDWLDTVRHDALEVHLVGDLFDFWFEYTHVVPKGCVRLLSKVAQLIEEGVEVHFYMGNHDMWTFGYLATEIGMKVHSEPQRWQWFEKEVLVGHGDGLGPGDKGYKVLKKIFRNRYFQKCFSWIHPDVGMWLAISSSTSSRHHNKNKEDLFLGKEEWLYQYSLDWVTRYPETRYTIFGHRHLPIKASLGSGRVYFNLGEWFESQTYMRIDADGEELLAFQKPLRIFSLDRTNFIDSKTL